MLAGEAGLLIRMRDNSMVALGPYPKINKQRQSCSGDYSLVN